MNDLTLRTGQVATALTLLRPLFPHDLLISHFDADQQLWKIDSCLGDFRTMSPSRRGAFDQAFEFLMKKRIEVQPQGRPRKERTTATYRTTSWVKEYLEELCRATKLDKSTMMSYLIISAHAAYRDKIGRSTQEVMDDASPDLTDYGAMLDTLRSRTFAGDLAENRRRDIYSEWQKLIESDHTKVAQTIRGEMENEEAEHQAKLDLAKAELLEAERKAQEELDKKQKQKRN